MPSGSASVAPAPSAGVRLLSILVPVYNEARTVPQLLDQLCRVPFPVAREIVVLDDGSHDGTREWLRSHPHPPGVRVLLHPSNLGKAAAIRSALAQARGDVIVIQDADLEYDPADLPRLLEPILHGAADVVYGSRWLGHAQGMSHAHRWGNFLLTWLTNRLFHVHLTDMETCYKMARASVWRGFELRSERFELEPEITAQMILSGARWLELPISYRARRHDDGKKISWRDGFAAIRVLTEQRWGRPRLARWTEQAALAWLVALLATYAVVLSRHFPLLTHAWHAASRLR